MSQTYSHPQPPETIESILHRFPSISLDEMKRVRLMKRVDTKYVTTADRLCRFLEMCTDDYYVQQIDGCTVMPYRTCYFDTTQAEMYSEHQRGRKTRQKIRLRVYENSDTAFLEIKNKNNRGRTDKKRITVGSSDEIMQHADFIRSNSVYAPEDLKPHMQNHFYRITLVNRQMTERLTIDTGLWFRNYASGTEFVPAGLAIIELKREGRSVSHAADMLRRLHIHPSGFSKYCMGMALTDPALKQHRLRERLRMLHKLCRDNAENNE